jgi:hypothetical protein
VSSFEDFPEVAGMRDRLAEIGVQLPEKWKVSEIREGCAIVEFENLFNGCIVEQNSPQETIWNCSRDLLVQEFRLDGS